MEEKHSTTLYFYPSKVKMILFIIMGVIFVVSGVVVCFIAFKYEEYVMSIIGSGMVILFILMWVLFVVSVVAFCFIAFQDEEYVMSIIGAGMAIFFIWLLFILIKRLITAAPYLILTEEELKINPYTEKSIPIKWEDIEG